MTNIIMVKKSVIDEIIEAVLEDAEIVNVCEHCMEGDVYAEIYGKNTYKNLVDFIKEKIKEYNRKCEITKNFIDSSERM